MSKRQFTIRTLWIVTPLVRVALPFEISHYDDFANFLFPHRSPVTQNLPEGVVLRIGSNRKLVAISLGSGDGLKKGQAVLFTRNGVYVGAGVIILSHSNQSACRISNGNVLQQDCVTIK